MISRHYLSWFLVVSVLMMTSKLSATDTERVLVIQAETGEAIELNQTQVQIVGDPSAGEEDLMIQYQLTQPQAEVFASMTEKNRGRPMLLLLNGLVIGNPVFGEPVTGRTGTITVESVYAEDIQNALNPKEN